MQRQVPHPKHSYHPRQRKLYPQDLWASSETNEQVYQQKLRVIYLPAEGQVLEEEDESGVAGATSTMTAAESHYGTVRQSALPKGADFSVSDSQGPVHEERAHTPTQDPTDDHSREYSIPSIVEPTIAPDFVPLAPADEPVPTQEPINEPEHDLAPIPPVPEPVPEPAPSQVQTLAPVPVPPPALPSQPIIIENPLNEELYAKYNLAKQEIDNLKAQMASLQAAAAAPTELRKRTRRTSEPDSAATSDVQTMLEDPTMQQEGVPLQVVVFIALGVFITTYLFF
jgi:vesicle-associated membrane protein-associated protein A